MTSQMMFVFSWRSGASGLWSVLAETCFGNRMPISTMASIEKEMVSYVGAEKRFVIWITLFMERVSTDTHA